MTTTLSVRLDTTTMKRLEVLAKVPEDFNTMGQAEIATLFGTDK